MGHVSCESCRVKTDEPTTSETPDPNNDRAEDNNKPIDLKLERLSNAILKRSQKACFLRISNHGTQKLEPEQLQLLITREKGNIATINGAKDLQDGTYSLEIAEVIGKGEAEINKEITINLNNDTEAVFKFQLQYKGDIQKGVEEKITCEVGKLEIGVHQERFVGENIVSFRIDNNTENDIEVSDLSIEVVSNNKASFQLAKEGSNENFAKLGVATSKVQDINPLKIIKNGQGIFSFGAFTIFNPNGETKAEVVVKLKKGEEEISVSKKVIWEAKSVHLKLKVKSRQNIAQDNTPLNLELSNIGNIPINTDDIKVILSNDAGISFKLGPVSGKKIDVTLSKILGTSAILDDKSSPLSFLLQLASDLGSIKQYAIKLPLVFQDQNNNLLMQKELLWVNNDKIMKLQDPEVIELQKKLENLRDNDPNEQDNNDDPDYVFPWKSEVKYHPELIAKLGERAIAAFQLLPKAEASIPKVVDMKKRVQNVLRGEGKYIPDFVKQSLQDGLQIPDDILVQQINQLVKESFEIVEECTQTGLRKAKETPESIAYINAWVAVTEKFAQEIGTEEAKDLAAKVKSYQTQAEKLQKP